MGVIFDKLGTVGHVMLCNEMGLGKTKVFAAMVECAARASAGNGPGEEFYPTLVVSPVSTIHQTHAEFKRNFPGLNIFLYYSWSYGGDNHRFGSDARIIDKSDFLGKLQQLKPTDPVVSWMLGICLGMVFAANR